MADGGGVAMAPPQNRHLDDDRDDDRGRVVDGYPLGSVAATTCDPLPPPSPSPRRSPHDVAAARKLSLLIPLVLALFALSGSSDEGGGGDDDDDEIGVADDAYDHDDEYGARRRKRLAFVSALSRHPETFRIYRLAWEISFLLLCLSFSLRVWERAGLSEDVGRLLFAPPPIGVYSNSNVKETARRARSLFVLRRGGRGRRRRRKRRRRKSNAGDDDDEYDDGGEIYDMSLRPRHDVVAEDDDNDDDECRTMPTSYNDAGEDLRCDDNDDDGVVVRSSSPSSSMPLPPSSTSVLGAALDLLTLTCGSLLLCTVCISLSGGGAGGRAGNDVVADSTAPTFVEASADVMAPLFPLILFAVTIVASVYPWARRGSTWTIVSLTVAAPFCPVTFRDGFVGDVLTSTVRPLQDLVTVIFHLPARAAWRGMGPQSAAMASSWLLHTVVLPGCTLSPLWWRFLQNLRQCYDAKRRWPYLGNATKYLLAAEVSAFAMFDPSRCAITLSPH
ncbi:hypothetical protein ACHAW5_005754 [Stephanodiscus triporus]|uniref:EXS domain-containing protein n=1 Tax=Stephanodiscus triporus TaxID=2934178 RepID=A0ABD3NXF2_9STRA